MTTIELVDLLGLTPRTTVLEREVTGAICSDLLSDILANGAPGYVWITIQAHRNVAAVASAQDLAAVIITSDRVPSDDLLEMAEAEQVVILSTSDSSYTAAGRLYELGVR